MNQSEIISILEPYISGLNDRVLIMLVGAPASNKTSLANYLKDELDIPSVSPNDIRQHLTHNGEDQVPSSKLFAEVYDQLRTFLRDERVVIYDATNCYPKWRIAVLNDLDSCYTKAICIVSHVSLIDCVMNNRNNHYDVPDDVIERMRHFLTQYPPNLDEGFDMILRYEYDG